jgi:serine protease AprX
MQRRGHEGVRTSALWGRGSKGKGARFAARMLTLLVVAALTIGLGTANAAAAVNGAAKKVPAYTSTATYPDGSFLARAQASASDDFPVIVQAESSKQLKTVLKWAGSYGKLKRTYNVITGIAITLPGSAILYIAEHPNEFGTVTITEDAPVQLSAQTGPGNWQATVGADLLWTHNAITCGTSTSCTPSDAFVAPQAPGIAIVDSGIDPTKTKFFGTRIRKRVDFVGDGASGDPDGHGTMVAGIAAGQSYSVFSGGVAQNAPLVDLRVADANGRADTSDVIAALDWVLTNGASQNVRVVNLSLAGTMETSLRFDPLDKAVERLWLDGFVVVASVGNNGSDSGPVPLAAPGNDPFIITVGATDTNGTVTAADDFRAPWSAYGYTADGFMKPELVAPGRYMTAPIPTGSTIYNAEPRRRQLGGNLWMSGTSFSAPVVTGLAAQLLASHPDWTPDQVKGALMLTARTITGAGAGVGEVYGPAANALVAPPNPNAALEQFLATDPDSGLTVFDADAWRTYAMTNASWASASWSAASWSAASWSAASWASASWASASWASASWASASWAVASWAASTDVE